MADRGGGNHGISLEDATKVLGGGLPTQKGVPMLTGMQQRQIKRVLANESGKGFAKGGMVRTHDYGKGRR